MSIEPVVRHDTPQIRMPHEEHPEQIIYLPLVPIRAIIQPCDARHRRGFIRIGLHSYARVVSHAEKVVDDLEALVARGVVYGCYVGDHGVFGRCVVFEEGDNGDDTRGGDVDRELIFPDGELLYVFGEAGDEVLAVGV